MQSQVYSIILTLLVCYFPLLVAVVRARELVLKVFLLNTLLLAAGIYTNAPNTFSFTSAVFFLGYLFLIVEKD